MHHVESMAWEEQVGLWWRSVLMYSKHILHTLFDWMLALSGVLSMSFVDFILLPLFFICILWRCTHHFMYLPTSFSNKTFTYQKTRWSVIISLSYYHPRLVIWSRHSYLLYYFIVCLDAWLRQRPFHAFCWCLLLPLYVICILWRGFVHIVLCVIPFSFSNQTCNYERWLIIINCLIIIQGWRLEVGMSLLAL